MCYAWIGSCLINIFLVRRVPTNVVLGMSSYCIYYRNIQICLLVMLSSSESFVILHSWSLLFKIFKILDQSEISVQKLENKMELTCYSRYNVVKKMSISLDCRQFAMYILMQ